MVSIKANVFFFKKTSPSTFVSTEDKTLDVNKKLLVRPCTVVQKGMQKKPKNVKALLINK